MPGKDLDFSFDPSPIINGFKKIAQTSMSTFAIMKGGIFRVIGGLEKLAGNMPEIGQAFGIMKDVMMKNLLWPLRQAIMPILVKLMNWVRDNRGLFVKWGMVIKNVFIVATEIFKKFWNILKGVGDFLFKIVNKMLGMSTKNLEEMVNIMVFKMAVAFELLSRLIAPIGKALEPVINFIAQLAGSALNAIMKFFTDLFLKGTSLNTIFTTIWETVQSIANFFIKIGSSLFDGFLKGLGDIGKPLVDIFNHIKGITDKLFTGQSALKGWEAVFKVIGEIIGGAVSLAFTALDKLLGGVEVAVEAIRWLLGTDVEKKAIENAWKKRSFDENMKFMENLGWGQARETGNRGEEFKNQIGIPNSSNSQTKNNTVNVGTINISIPNGDAKTIESGVKDGIRKTLVQESSSNGE